MSYRETKHLRVLIANERKDGLELVAPIVGALGHEVMSCEIEVEDVGPVTARERPDVAVVGLGESSEHALGLIDKIVRAARSAAITQIRPAGACRPLQDNGTAPQTFGAAPNPTRQPAHRARESVHLPTPAATGAEAIAATNTQPHPGKASGRRPRSAPHESTTRDASPDSV